MWTFLKFESARGRGDAHAGRAPRGRPLPRPGLDRGAAGAPLSWKVRYRTFPWFFSQMSKLYRARSLLYRRQILQENIRWKALDEIYKIYMLLHRSDLNIPEKIRQTFSHFSAIFCKIYPFSKNFIEFAQILMKFCRNFADILKIVEIKIFWIF